LPCDDDDHAVYCSSLETNFVYTCLETNFVCTFGGGIQKFRETTRAARSLERTRRPRLPGVRCPRATSCQRPPCVSRAAHHRAKQRAGVWCSLPMLGPCAQRQRYATACCAYRPTFIRCLSINPPPPPRPPPPRFHHALSGLRQALEVKSSPGTSLHVLLKMIYWETWLLSYWE